MDIPADEPKHEDAEEDAEDDPFDYYAFLFIVSNTFNSIDHHLHVSRVGKDGRETTYIRIPESIISKTPNIPILILDTISLIQHHLHCVSKDILSKSTSNVSNISLNFQTSCQMSVYVCSSPVQGTRM
jgi:hypothetical protein